MPLPKDCGKASKPCCPGNAAKPFVDPRKTAKPTCSDGSYCFYTPTPDASGWSAPAYASPAGSLLGEQTAMQRCSSLLCGNHVLPVDAAAAALADIGAANV
jgi:hypothetical protein